MMFSGLVFTSSLLSNLHLTGLRSYVISKTGGAVVSVVLPVRRREGICGYTGEQAGSQGPFHGGLSQHYRSALGSLGRAETSGNLSSLNFKIDLKGILVAVNNGI